MFFIHIVIGWSRLKSNSMPRPSGSSRAVHQPAVELRVGDGHLDRKVAHPGLGDDLQGLQLGGVQRAARRQDREERAAKATAKKVVQKRIAPIRGAMP